MRALWPHEDLFEMHRGAIISIPGLTPLSTQMNPRTLDTIFRETFLSDTELNAQFLYLLGSALFGRLDLYPAALASLRVGHHGLLR